MALDERKVAFVRGTRTSKMRKEQEGQLVVIGLRESRRCWFLRGGDKFPELRPGDFFVAVLVDFDHRVPIK